MDGNSSQGDVMVFFGLAVLAVLGLVPIVGGWWIVRASRGGPERRSERVVDTLATVVDHEARQRSNRHGTSSTSARWVWYLAPVLEWLGPDGQVRRGVPLGDPCGPNPPGLGAPMTISYDPQDLSWFALAGTVSDRGRGFPFGVGLVLIGLLPLAAVVLAVLLSLLARSSP